jgi:hypothetical protein
MGCVQCEGRTQAQSCALAQEKRDERVSTASHLLSSSLMCHARDLEYVVWRAS